MPRTENPAQQALRHRPRGALPIPGRDTPGQADSRRLQKRQTEQYGTVKVVGFSESA